MPEITRRPDEIQIIDRDAARLALFPRLVSIMEKAECFLPHDPAQPSIFNGLALVYRELLAEARNLQ